MDEYMNQEYIKRHSFYLHLYSALFKFQQENISFSLFYSTVSANPGNISWNRLRQFSAQSSPAYCELQTMSNDILCCGLRLPPITDRPGFCPRNKTRSERKFSFPLMVMNMKAMTAGRDL
jgi:hypothetical protein